jgi:hypothetical protein
LVERRPLRISGRRYTVKKLTLVVALFAILLVGFGTSANADFSVSFGFGLAPLPPPVVVPPPVYYPAYPVPPPYYYPVPGYYAPRYYAPPPIAFGLRFGDRGWHGDRGWRGGRPFGNHWR